MTLNDLIKNLKAAALEEKKNGETDFASGITYSVTAIENFRLSFDKRNIEIEVEGGVVQSVENLPDGWTYTVNDLD